MLDAMTNTHGTAPYVSTWFGFGMVITMTITAVVVARARKKQLAWKQTVLDESPETGPLLKYGGTS
jgi:hypothetical protein